MAFRFMMFVDGSNLYGVSRKLRLDFNDYEGLFGRFFHACHEQWSRSFSEDARPATRFVRTYWYVVGTADEWDFKTSGPWNICVKGSPKIASSPSNG